MVFLCPRQKPDILMKMNRSSMQVYTCFNPFFHRQKNISTVKIKNQRPRINILIFIDLAFFFAILGLC